MANVVACALMSALTFSHINSALVFWIGLTALGVAFGFAFAFVVVFVFFLTALGVVVFALVFAVAFVVFFVAISSPPSCECLDLRLESGKAIHLSPRRAIRAKKTFDTLREGKDCRRVVWHL